MATALILARAGSKELPHKNRRMLSGKPLYLYSVEAALAAKSIDHIILSTNDIEILIDADEYKQTHSLNGSYTVVERPDSLAEDDTSTQKVITYLIDLLDGNETDAYVLLQPTSPLRTGVHIDEAIALIERDKADSVVSVQRTHHLMWESGDGVYFQGCRPLYNPLARPRRQDMDQYSENGALYVFTPELWKRGRGYVGGRISLYEMSDERSFQVDTAFDFWLIEQVMKHG